MWQRILPSTPEITICLYVSSPPHPQTESWSGRRNNAGCIWSIHGLERGHSNIHSPGCVFAQDLLCWKQKWIHISKTVWLSHSLFTGKSASFAFRTPIYALGTQGATELFPRVQDRHLCLKTRKGDRWRMTWGSSWCPHGISLLQASHSHGKSTFPRVILTH